MERDGCGQGHGHGPPHSVSLFHVSVSAWRPDNRVNMGQVNSDCGMLGHEQASIKNTNHQVNSSSWVGLLLKEKETEQEEGFWQFHTSRSDELRMVKRIIHKDFMQINLLRVYPFTQYLRNSPLIVRG